MIETMWFMVCRWPQSQDGDWARPHLCMLARHGRLSLSYFSYYFRPMHERLIDDNC